MSHRAFSMLAIGWLLLATLVGCDRFTTREAQPSTDAVRQLADLMTGTFGNAAQAREDAAIAAVRYQISRVPCVNRVAEVCLFSQRFQGGDLTQPVAPRLYLLRPAADGVRVMIESLPVDLTDLGGREDLEERLGEIPPAPLDQECAVTLRRNGGEWRGTTDPARCQVPLGADRRGLKRTLALVSQGLFLSESLYAGEQWLTGHQDGQGIFARRIAFYEGRAGALDSDSGQWTLSAPLSISNDGQIVDLLDNNGNELGYRLSLAVLPADLPEATMLRLSVMDGDSGATLGHAWAHPEAAQIGIHVGNFQAGLRRESHLASSD